MCTVDVFRSRRAISSKLHVLACKDAITNYLEHAYKFFSRKQVNRSYFNDFQTCHKKIYFPTKIRASGFGFIKLAQILARLSNHGKNELTAFIIGLGNDSDIRTRSLLGFNLEKKKKKPKGNANPFIIIHRLLKM